MHHYSVRGFQNPELFSLRNEVVDTLDNLGGDVHSIKFDSFPKLIFFAFISVQVARVIKLECEIIKMDETLNDRNDDVLF